MSRPLQTLRLMNGLTLLAILSMTQAYAELTVYEQPIQQRASAAQGRDTKAYSAQNINSQLPSDKSVIKLMQVMHIDEQITAIINSQQAAIDVINTQANNANKQSAGDKLNKRQRELQTKIQGILGQYSLILSDSVNEATDSEKMTQAYINAAKAYYNQAEVDAQISFYNTPTGQSILAKQPQVTAAFLQQSLPKDMNLEDTKAQLEALLPQMRQIIKDIL